MQNVKFLQFSAQVVTLHGRPKEAAMRIRAIAAIVILLVPAALSAQRIPLPIGRRPPRGEPLPPTAGPIAKEQAYRRWRLSVESYPMVSYYQASGFGSWTSLGAGTHADYLINRHVSATLDMTSSLIGSPSTVNTAEVGTRLHPEWAEHRLYPYADVRVAYIAVFNSQFGTIDNSFSNPVATGTYGAPYSRGYGAIAGGGLEYSLTHSWSLTTGASIVSASMRSHDLSNSVYDGPYHMTGFRYTLGVRYNPVTIIRQGGDIR
jgi:hypothetical protein